MPKKAKGGWPFLVQARKSGEAGGVHGSWSQAVSQASNALDLEAGIFSGAEPRAIAQSLKDAADVSERRKAPAFQSAMSMLTFYINRAGAQLPAAQRARLEAAKDELRELYGRPRLDKPAHEKSGKNRKAAPVASPPGFVERRSSPGS